MEPEDISPLLTAQEVLMSDISEDCYCAGWMTDLEFDLYALWVGDRDSYGECDRHRLEERLLALGHLSNITEMWLRWNDDISAHVDVEPVPLSEWRWLYEKWKSGEDALNKRR